MTDGKSLFDTSAVLPFLVPHPLSNEAEAAMIETEPVFLSFSKIEVANALRTFTKARHLSSEMAGEILAEFITLPDFEDEHLYLRDALQLGIKFDHGVYDCLFVAASIALNVPLITADKKLRNKFAGHVPGGVILLGSAETADFT